MINFKAPAKLHKALGVPAVADPISSSKPKPSAFSKSAKGGFSPPSAKSTLGKIASGKPPKQTLSPVKSDRGDFQIKG